MSNAHALNGGPVLAVDLGGTKLLVALIDNGQVLARATMATDFQVGPDEWVRNLTKLARAWAGQYQRAGVAVTGRVQDGLWSALNTNILAISADFPLQAACEQALGVPVLLKNDAQEAAWGEYRYGAGQGRDLVYLTISTGMGGGIIANGQLLNGRGGLTGHVGQMLSLVADADEDTVFEDQVTGRWIASEAAKFGYTVDARRVFQAAGEGGGWAQAIVETSARRAARLCRNLQLLLDPEVIIIGGGIGLATGYLDRVTQELDALPAELRPTLVPAALGDQSGAIGIAALTAENQPKPTGKHA